MGSKGERRRALWRWTVGVWTAAVMAGGGATLWLQDAAEPPPPARWEEAEPSPSPEPRCPPRDDLPESLEDGFTAYACVITDE